MTDIDNVLVRAPPSSRETLDVHFTHLLLVSALQIPANTIITIGDALETFAGDLGMVETPVKAIKPSAATYTMRTPTRKGQIPAVSEFTSQSCIRTPPKTLLTADDFAYLKACKADGWDVNTPLDEVSCKLLCMSQSAVHAYLQYLLFSYVRTVPACTVTGTVGWEHWLASGYQTGKDFVRVVVACQRC